MRTNIFLRSYSNYKPTIGNSICRERSSSMSMRRVRGRQRNTHTILRTTLPNTIRNHSNSINSPTIPTPNRIEQPPRFKQKHRQNPIPPLLHSKRHCWIRSSNYTTNNFSTKRTLHTKRSRQLHPC
jgi:hypothetical protein